MTARLPPEKTVICSGAYSAGPGGLAPGGNGAGRKGHEEN